jgi:hypothetical protein
LGGRLRALKYYLNGLREQGVTNLQAYLEESPKVVEARLGRIPGIDVNRKTFQLFGASGND